MRRQPTTDVPMLGGNPARTGVHPGPGPIDSPEVRWRFATGGEVLAVPVVVAGVVYAGSREGFLYALDAATGTERWRFPIGTIQVCRPAVVRGAVYVSGDRTLYAVDAAADTERWRLAGAGGDPVVAGDTVYAGAWDGPLFAVDAATGSERWRLDVGGATASPTVTGGLVCVGGRAGGVTAIG